MTADRLRRLLIVLLAVTGATSFVANKAGERWLGIFSFTLFLVAVLVYAQWRRKAREERSARVFDREAKTDETGSGADQ